MSEKSARLTRYDLLAMVALATLNLSICWRFFKIDYNGHFSSIEGAWVGLANYLSHHWGDFSWFPLWHCGMPYADTYVPLVHLMAAATASVFHCSAAHGYHAVTGVAYALGPVTLYLMASRLGAGPGNAFASALFYSLLSPCTLLMPDMAKDVGGFWNPRRLQVLVAYGEGPHIAAMALLPLAVLALQNAVHTRTRRALAWAALALALIFLTNVPGTMATAVAVFCWLCVQPASDRRTAWILAALAAAFAYAIACYGIPPSSLGMVFGNVVSMHAGFSASLKVGPFLLLATLAVTAALGWLLARTRLPLYLRFAVLNFLLIAAMVLTARPQRFELLPQVGRLHLEMEMGACLILGSCAWFLYSLVPGWSRPVVWVLCLAPIGLQMGNYRNWVSHDLGRVDLAKRSEYTSARWVDANLPGRRTYVTGSTGFWWNTFTESPQVLGCCAQNQWMPVLEDLPYVVNLPNEANTARIKPYLQALGVQVLIANGPDSTDEYKDIRSPDRLDQVLPVLHRELGDTIYAVPQRSVSMAHVIRGGDAVAVPSPPNRAPGPDDIVRYAAALQDPARPVADFKWVRGDTARITMVLAPDDVVSVQLAGFRGWKAYADGHAVPITRDGLGFLLVHPHSTGPSEIRLRWTGSPDGVVSALISLAALAGFGWLVFAPGNRLRPAE